MGHRLHVCRRSPYSMVIERACSGISCGPTVLQLLDAVGSQILQTLQGLEPNLHLVVP